MAAAELPVAIGREQVLQLERDILNYIDAAVMDAEALLRTEPAYDEMDQAISYIMGDQLDPARPSTLSHISDNILKDVILKTVAALTDIHPLFGFKTYNDYFQQQSDVLTKLSQSWWVNTYADLKLADVIRYAAGMGTGYAEIQWSPEAADGQGDIEIIPRDPRDVLPIRPTYDTNIQSWEGVIIRVAKTTNELRARYPDKAHRIHADRTGSAINRMWGKARRLLNIATPSAVDVANSSAARNVPAKVPACDVYNVWLKDRRMWTGDAPIVVGDPDTTWCYTVYPVGSVMPDGKKAGKDESRIYPRGRLIIATKEVVLYDGPNPYWHGKFPLAKLCLDPWPWSLLGNGLCHDFMPLQDAINELINGIMDHARKTLRPALIADKKSVPESVWQRIDTRMPGLKMKANSAIGKGVEMVSPEPLEGTTFELLKLMMGEIQNRSGVMNLDALSTMQQAPAADSIERMMEALTPTLRLKGRLLESFLREVGEMVKANFFQFYNMPRRMAILGEQGLSFSDFDFEPGTLVPAMDKQDPHYTPDLDKDKPLDQRAQWHHKNFTFMITPNSLLAISQISRKMMYLQLWRGGLMDPWTLFDVLEIPNGGAPPQGATTITDRLAEANQMGISGQTGPAGRKASGAQPPHMESKGDGRPVMSESR